MTCLKIHPSDILSLPVIILSLVLPVSFNARSNNDSSPDDGKCELIGTFSLLTQAFLGLLCLLSLIIKRSYEYPIRRTWSVWFFDVSKQLIGALGVHIFNVLLSLIKLGDLGDEIADKLKLPKVPNSPVVAPPASEGSDPCDWYFLNIVFDCTVGVFILYHVFKVVTKFCKSYLGITQIESGQYGPDVNRPSVRAYLKQLLIYFTSLMITKLILFVAMECFETQLLWITKHILLVWLDEYPDEFEIFIVMFVVPIFMNCLQLVLIDNFIRNQVWLRVNKRMHEEHPNDRDVQVQQQEIAELLQEELLAQEEVQIVVTDNENQIQSKQSLQIHECVNNSDSSDSSHSTLVDKKQKNSYGTFDEV